MAMDCTSKRPEQSQAASAQGATTGSRTPHAAEDGNSQYPEPSQIAAARSATIHVETAKAKNEFQERTPKKMPRKHRNEERMTCPRICAHCRHLCSDAANFCEECGSKLVEDEGSRESRSRSARLSHRKDSEEALLVSYVFGGQTFESGESEDDIFLKLGKALGAHINRQVVKLEPVEEITSQSTLGAIGLGVHTGSWEMKRLGEQVLLVDELSYTQRSMSRKFKDGGSLDQLVVDLNSSHVDPLRCPTLWLTFGGVLSFGLLLYFFGWAVC